MADVSANPGGNMRNWINAENAPTINCSECGAQTWKPLECWPPGWGVDGGLIYCNLHLPVYG